MTDEALHNLSTGSSQAASTTATLFSTVLLTTSSDDCSQFCMLPRGWSPVSDPTNTSHRRCVTLSTGCRYHSASPSKIALMMFDCSRSRCLKYFCNVCTPVHTVAFHSWLRSAEQGDLIVPRVWSIQFGCSSFRIRGPAIWNTLPQDLRSADTREQFKRRLKNWLFECALYMRQEARLINVDWGRAV